MPRVLQIFSHPKEGWWVQGQELCLALKIWVLDGKVSVKLLAWLSQSIPPVGSKSP